MHATLKMYRNRLQIVLALIPASLLVACTTSSNSLVDKPMPTIAAPTISKTLDTSEQTALRKLTAQQDRLYRVAAPLLTNNTQLCKSNARNLLGFTAKNRYSYSAEFAHAAQAIGFDNRLQVTGVLPGSGAAHAGVQRGDILLAVIDQPLKQGPDAERQAANVLGPLITNRTPIKLTILRNNTERNLIVPLTLACAFSIEFGNTDNVNTYADGRRILITRGMLNFTQSDEELAYLIAKDMAHNTLGHIRRQRMATTVSSIIDNLMRTQADLNAIADTDGIRPYPQDLDAAADKLALYMLVRAAYHIDGYAQFWQRLATQYPATVPNSYTALHPDIAYRLIMIDKSTQEIKAKQTAGKPLIP